MATDGGQVRLVDKVLAEENHSKTVTSNTIMPSQKLALGNGARRLIPQSATDKGIVIIDATGNATYFPIPEGEAGYNKQLSINSNSELEWIDQEGGA
jgi:hypothetical protein